MAKYKGFEIDDEVYSVIRYMGNVKQYHEALEKQQVSWDYLSVMAKLSSLDHELTDAKGDFSNLTGLLLNRLGSETLNKSANEYAFKAHVAINILNRNLFERTADIGFLAIDDDIRHFLKNTAVPIDTETHASMRHQLKLRFQEYVNKYSVYQDVVLFDKNGQMLVRLDDTEPKLCSKAPLIQESLYTDNAYVETYGAIDFILSQQHNLVYSYRVTSESGEALGVICLCFKFDNECEGIFERLRTQGDHAVLMLLNKEGQVIASSDESEVPCNTQLHLTHAAHFQLINFRNRTYFTCVKSADAYQGYVGAGWLGCLMVPVEEIFNQKSESEALELAPEVIRSAHHGALFNQETKNISVIASQIQNTLDRSVWNGNVYQASEKNGPDAAVSKVILGEIKNTGIITKRIFENSISEIQSTIIATTLKQSESNAALAIDIMDRNLYERANDCRWWALNATFRALLSQPTLQDADLKTIEHILISINNLYTVYSNLIVFNRAQKVLAVSNAQYQFLVGTTLNDAWVSATLQLQTTAQYVVSDFVNTPLYNGESSYIYAAGIRDTKDAGVVGGIGIVFDSTPQFLAILEDVIPKDIDDRPQSHCFAVYVDANKKVISSSSERFKVGDLFEIDAAFLSLQKGQSFGKVQAFGEYYYAIGCSKSSGYREFKGKNDRYQQDIYALVFIEIGEVKSIWPIDQPAHYEPLKGVSGNKGKTQLATFYVDQHWLGFYSECVSGAVSVSQLVQIHGEEHSFVAGYMMYKGESIMVLHTPMLMGAAYPARQAIEELVVIKVAGKLIGLSIDKLGSIIDIDGDMVQPISEPLAQANKVVRHMVLSSQEEADQLMLKIMDVALIARLLNI